MTDVDLFAPLGTITLPDAPLHVLAGPDRGGRTAHRSPDDALPARTAEGRTPMPLGEGIHWVLQHPDVLERNHCFMTIGSRPRKPGGALDSRTPAIWISNGTGRDGRERRNAPKVGWCRAGNRTPGWGSPRRRAARTDRPRRGDLAESGRQGAGSRR